jgi:hypothetical protein
MVICHINVQITPKNHIIMCITKDLHSNFYYLNPWYNPKRLRPSHGYHTFVILDREQINVNVPYD